MLIVMHHWASNRDIEKVKKKVRACLETIEGLIATSGLERSGNSSFSDLLSSILL
jgi:hypothetical protein